MAIIPERRASFGELFDRFVASWFTTPDGRELTDQLRRAITEGREHYGQIMKRREDGEEVTEDVLLFLIPHGDSQFSRESGAWQHPAQAITADIKLKFEKSGWIRPEDWPAVASAFLELIETGVERPDTFEEACREFNDHSLVKGMQSAFVTPILNALRPDLYSIINMKPRKVLNWLTGEVYGSRVVDYPSVNAELRSVVDQLADVIDPHVPDDLDRYHVFDLFTHWVVSVDRFFVKEAGEEDSRSRLRQGNTTLRLSDVDLFVQLLLPDQAKRIELLRVFAEIVQYVDSLNDNNWHLSYRRYGGMLKSRLALTAGYFRVAAIEAESVVVWLPASLITDDIEELRHQHDNASLDWQSRDIDQAVVGIRITHDLIEQYYGVLQPIFFDFVQDSSRKSVRSAFRSYHQPNVIEYISEVTSIDLPQPDYYIKDPEAWSTEGGQGGKGNMSRNYWWLNCNPSVWDVADLDIDQEQSYTAYNENGNRRLIYKHMQALRPGDLMVGYVTTPRKRVEALFEITRPLTPTGNNEEFTFRKVQDALVRLPWSEIRQSPILMESEPMSNNQGSLFALTEEEFFEIAEQAGFEIDGVEFGPATRSDLRNVVATITQADEFTGILEQRAAAEERARTILQERLGRMTEEDIREFLGEAIISHVDAQGKSIRNRFGVALMGSLANMISGDPETFNHWVGRLWNDEGEELEDAIDVMLKSRPVKGGGISLTSLILYLRDPDQFGMALPIMWQELRQHGYDAPEKVRSATEYLQYARALNSFLSDSDLPPTMADYVLFRLNSIRSDGPGKGPTVSEPGRKPLLPDPPTLETIADSTCIEESLLQRWVDGIHRKKQAILYGPPGTGKTFVAKELARYLISGGTGETQIVQFHPAYGYEDFIHGIRPDVNEETDELRYVATPGQFMKFCRMAETKGDDLCVMIIDEINRADLARVFGELMYLLEYRGESIPIASGGRFSIPENVRIIGTMNTADRSIALVDHALRRRFAFLEVRPDYDLLRKYHQRHRTGFDPEGLIGEIERANQAISDPHYSLGVSYFLQKDVAQTLADIWQTEIEPYLVEHFFDRPSHAESFRWSEVRGKIES